MLSSQAYSPSMTDVKISCPPGVTGIERIMLAAEGTLQRLLSAFFARPITIHSIWKHNSTRQAPASPCYPIIQERQVHLRCAGRTVCIATSTVTVTSAECERLLLDENYAIGQLFRQLGCTPQFTLLDVQLAEVDGRNELERTYMLDGEGVSCRINELFPDREMFVHCEAWLGDSAVAPSASDSGSETLASHISDEPDASQASREIPDFFHFTPHSIASTPTLSSILDKQASDPVIQHKVFAAYPRPISSPGDNPYTEITYAHFSAIVNHEARHWFDLLSPFISPFRTQGPDAEPPLVAVLADSGFNYAVMIMALLKLNVTLLLLAPSNSEAAISHLVTVCHADFLIHGPRYSQIAHAVRATSGVLPVECDERPLSNIDSVVDSTPDHRVLHDSPPEVPLILHSSGSTSFPKPVRWSNTNLLSHAQVLLTGDWSVFTRPDNRFICLGPMFHALGVSLGLAGTICAGTTLVFPLCQSWPPTPSELVKSFKATKINTCISVPLLLEQFVDALESDASTSLKLLSDLDLLLTGGAHCPAKLGKFLVSYGVNLACIYGSSETGHVMVGSHDRQTLSESTWNLMRPFPHTNLILKPVSEDAAPNQSSSLYEVHTDSTDSRLAPGVLQPGTSTWNTGDVVEETPPGSGWYKLLYRNDDILVHVSGEKTNPVPMEITCREEKVIEHIAVVGSGRPVTAAIVQLNAIEARKYSSSERIRLVQDAVKKANLAAPKHSQILEEMILILPLDYHKSIPRTPKGNFIRPKVLQVFSEEIDQLYRNFEGDSGTETDFESTQSSVPTSSSASSTLTLTDVQSVVIKAVDSVSEKALCDIPGMSDKSLFELGLDSVTAMQLRSRLSKAFDINLPQKFVYQYFTVSLLSSALFERLVGQDISSPKLVPIDRDFKDPNRGKIMRELFERHLHSIQQSANLLRASQLFPLDSPSSTSEAKEVVAVVGANGSLGIWQVKSLLDSSNVRKVVCMLRGSSVESLFQKLEEGFAKAALTSLATQCAEWRQGQLAHPGVPAATLDQRLVVVPFDLANAHIEEQEYLALGRTLTAIIHTGWKMDFNQVVQGFEDCIAGTARLLLLAGFMRPKKFYFVSSIGVVLESKQNPVPEELIPWVTEDDITASPHGYSESKFICEHLVHEASTLLNIPCAIARVGQIAGDSVSGVWKVQEMNPIIIAGSQRIGKYPVVDGAIVDWVPVDYVGQMMVSLALEHSSVAGSVPVHHISHPQPSSYKDMVDHLNCAGVIVEAASPRDWWRAIQDDQENPCHAISSYIEEAVVDAHEDMAQRQESSIELAIEKTTRLAPDLSGKCPSLDDSMWQKYVTYWRRIGFLQ